jgi:hypothetical protein
MGLRKWFRKSTANPSEAPSSPDDVTAEAENAAAFAVLQEQRASEALTLLDATEDIEEEPPVVEAPYDASEADVATLLENEADEAFTHLDEVTIDDVAVLDDPYETATVEGDLPQPVVLGESENIGSV